MRQTDDPIDFKKTGISSPRFLCSDRVALSESDHHLLARFAMACGHQNYPGVFITGTDTGVGKTLIAGALARLLYASGVNVGVMKPIETGCSKRFGRLIPQDACYLKKAARVNDALELINPYRFKDPIAPWPASIREGRKIQIRKILAAYNRLKRRHSFLIVEGVGGLRVPLTKTTDVVDLIKALALPVLLVARSGLGTLNHTLLSLKEGQAHGIQFLGIILNETQSEKTLADQTNRSVLSQRTSLPLLGPFPYIRDFKKTDEGIELSRKRLYIGK